MKQQIQCRFSYGYFNDRKLYLCNISDQTIDEDRDLELIGGHLAGMCNQNVTYVYIATCILSKIPQGLTKFFPNLQMLDIEATTLSLIKRDDLIEYQELTDLYFRRNRLQFLDGDLFDDFENLKAISFNGNPMKFIEPTFLDKLIHLNYVSFRDCLFIDVRHDPSSLDPGISLEEMKQHLHEKYQESPWKRFSEERRKDIELLNDLKRVMQDESLTDITVTVGAEKFDVHKFILAARSPVLAELIKSNPNASILNFKSCSSSVFRAIYNFIYANELPKSDNIDFTQLLITSEKKIN